MRNNIERQVGVLILVLVVALMCYSVVRASTEAPTKQKPSEYQVNIQDFSFEPDTVSVPVGATVTWTNKDEEPHTVFSNDDVFKSRALDTDEKFSFKFTKAGTYKYFCSVHPKMVATIEVGSSDKKSAPMKMENKRRGSD